ncbi:hypothetical protein ACO0SA_002090 [Hanseniaspora valbyensis]
MNKVVSLNTVKFPNLDIQHYKKLSTPRYLNALSVATINHHIRYDILRKAYLKRIIALKLKIKEHKDQESDLPLAGLNKKIDHHIAILNQSIIPNLKYLSSKELQDMVKLTVEESLITDKEFVIKFAEDLQSYNLKDVVDSIIPYEKYPQREAVNFLEGLKCSYKTSTGNLYNNVSEKLIKHFETITTETKHINKSGEELSSTRYDIKYDKLLSINKINEELFTKPELQNFITTFVHFCPVEHLDPLVYYFKENIVKSFNNEAHLSVMTAVLQRLSLEQYRYGESLRFLGMNNNNNRAKNVGYKTLLSKADLAEVKYSRAFVDKFKKNLVSKILSNMEINSEAKKEFLKQDGVINKSDVLTYYNMYFSGNKDLIEFVKTRENNFDLISERSFLELLPKE